MGYFLPLKEAGESSGFLSSIRPYVGNFLDCFDMFQVVQFTAISLLALVSANTEGIDQEKVQKRIDALVSYSFVYKNDINEKLGRKVDMPTLIREDEDIVIAAYGALHGDNNDTAEKNKAIARLIFGNDEDALSKAAGSSTIVQLLGTLAYSLTEAADPNFLYSKDEKNIGTVVGLLGGLDWNQKSLDGVASALSKTKLKSWAESLVELTAPLEQRMRKGVPSNNAAMGGASRKSALMESNRGH